MLVGLTDELDFDREGLDKLDPESLCDILQTLADEKYRAQEETFTPEVFRALERNILLANVDRNWMAYIDDADSLRGSIGLNAYAQRNPIIEYKIASSEMFESMVSDIRSGTVRMVLTIAKKEQAERKQIRITGMSGGGAPEVPKKNVPAVQKGKKVGPNDSCPCGSGKKYKKCCGSVGAPGAGKAE